MRVVIRGLAISGLLAGCMPMYPVAVVSKPKVVKDFEQVDVKKMIELYINKSTTTSDNSIEGIYTVSSVVTKKGKPLFASEEKEKVKDRDENYAKVAIIRDPGNPDREYMEVSLNKEGKPTFAIIGEFSHLAEGNLLVYRHFEDKGKSVTNYTFTYDESRDVLDGIRTENSGKATVTYQLTYLKVSPKSYIAGQ